MELSRERVYKFKKRERFIMCDVEEIIKTVHSWFVMEKKNYEF